MVISKEEDRIDPNLHLEIIDRGLHLEVCGWAFYQEGVPHTPLNALESKS